jgi:hypothetical protein
MFTNEFELNEIRKQFELIKYDSDILLSKLKEEEN